MRLCVSIFSARFEKPHDPGKDLAFLLMTGLKTGGVEVGPGLQLEDQVLRLEWEESQLHSGWKKDPVFYCLITDWYGLHSTKDVLLFDKSEPTFFPA